MITPNDLESVSYQLSKLSNFYAALALAVESIDDSDNRQARDAVIGLTEVIGTQIERSHGALAALFPIARDAAKQAEAA